MFFTTRRCVSSRVRMTRILIALHHKKPCADCKYVARGIDGYTYGKRSNPEIWIMWTNIVIWLRELLGNWWVIVFTGHGGFGYIINIVCMNYLYLEKFIIF